MSAREHDLVLLGATGYTGRLAAAVLARRGAGLRWALAGRDTARLAAVAKELAVEVPLLRADSTDPASMARLAASTRAVITTAGPFAVHGDPLVDACVEAGTHTCDITGEVPWVRGVIDRHHERARERGLRIVSFCGYDSVPSDLGCLVLQRAVVARHGRPASRIDCLADPRGGGVSGGTVHSGMRLAAERRTPGVREHLVHPGALTPGFTPPSRPDPMSVRRVDGVWGAPWLMAGTNGRCVHRTNQLLGTAWGADFVFEERMWAGRGLAGWARARALQAALLGLGLGFASAAGRALLARFLPAPGEGPSAASRRRASLHHHLVAWDGERRLGRLHLSGAMDPGYEATAIFLVECGLATLEPGLDTAGALTPAAAFGEALVPRLEAEGFRFELDLEPA